MTSDQPCPRWARISPDVLAFLGFFALAAAFYAPFLLGLRIFPPGDFTDHFLPFSLFQRAELLAGRLPLWNPFTFSGHPFLADVQAAVFYPLSNLVLLLTLPWSDAAARLYWLQVEAALHIALAGCFTYLLARDLARNRPAAFLAGGVFAFSGYLTGYPPLQLAVLRTAIWLPLILWLLRRAFGRFESPMCYDSRRWWLAAALAYAAAFLAGHSQTFLFISYAVTGWILYLFIVAGEKRTRYLWRIVAFYGLSVGLSAAQWLPSLEFAGLSVRASTDYAFVSGGFPVRDTWQMLLPGLLSTFSPLYVGLIPLGLALLGLVLSARRTNDEGPMTRATGAGWPAVTERRAALFFIALALLALLVSYGAHGFLYPLFYRWAPGWAFFRGQERAACLVAFGLSLLAGYGAALLDGLTTQGRRRAAVIYAVTAAIGLICAACALGVFIGPTARPELAEGRRPVVIGMILLAAWALILWLKLPPRRRLWLLIAVTLADLWAVNFATNLTFPRSYPPAEASAIQAAVRAAAPADGGAPGRSHNEDVLFENYGMFVGVEEVSGSSPLRLARYQALLDDFPRARLWRLTGVTTVLSSRPNLYVPVESRTALSGAGAPGYLFRLAAANPRAWVVHSVRTADDATALPLLSDASFDPERTALLPPLPPAGLEDGVLALPGANQVRLERLAPNALRAHVESEHGGLLVISENWLPGWRATVRRPDAPTPSAVPVLRADLTFLGAPVRPGRSTVELTYWPDSVRAGLAISGVALFVLVLLFVVRKRPSTVSRQLPIVNCQRLAMPAVLLLAFALRIFRLGYQELRGDEALGRLFSLESFEKIIASTIALREPHPVASYFVEKVWLGLAGHTEFAVRFASLWFGVLAVALLYRLGRRLGLGWGAAMLAATLLAISPYAIWHSQDARMYSMSLALTTASTLLMLEAVARRRLVFWLAYIGVTWLALHTHYYAVYIILVQNVFVFGRAIVSRSERRNAWPWLAAQAITGALYLPWLFAARLTLTNYVGNGDSPRFGALWMRSLSVFAAGESAPGEQRPLLALLAGALVLLGVARLALTGSTARRALWLLALYLGLPLLATWFGALSRPIFNERYLVAALPAFFLLVAAAPFRPERFLMPGALPGQDESREGRPGAHWRPWLSYLAGAGVVILIAAGALSLARHYDDPVYSKTRGWRNLAGMLARRSAGWPAEKVRVVQTYPDPTLWYYYTEPVEHLVLPPAAHDAAGAGREVAALVAQDVQRVMVAVQQSSAWDDRDIAAGALKQGGYTLLSETPVAGWRVQVYGRPPATVPPADVTFVGTPGAPGVRLTAAAVPIRRLIAGDVLPIYLRWANDAAASRGPEKITLQLLDPNGRLVAQTDQPFDPATAAYLVALPRFLPPGAYRLIVALYDPSRPSAPRWQTSAGADHVELAVLSAQ